MFSLKTQNAIYLNFYNNNNLDFSLAPKQIYKHEVTQCLAFLVFKIVQH